MPYAKKTIMMKSAPAKKAAPFKPCKGCTSPAKCKAAGKCAKK